MVLAGEEGLEGLIDDMARLSEASGRTEEALAKIMDTSAFVSNQIQQDWEKTQRDVGKAWDELALKIQAGTVEVAQNWASFIPVIGPIFTGMKAVADLEMKKWQNDVNREYSIGKALTKSVPITKAIEEQKEVLRNTQRFTKQYDIEFKKLEALKTRQWIEVPRIRKDDPQEVMKSYLTLQDQIAAQSQEVNNLYYSGNEGLQEAVDKLEYLVFVSSELQEGFNRAFGEPILGGVRNLEELHTTLSEIEFDIERLKGELEEEVTWGWSAKGKGEIAGTLNYQYELLEAEQLHVDIQHDIKMGLADETYGYKMLSAEMQDAIKIIREHEQAQKSNRAEMYRVNYAMRALQLQAAEIQLKGLLRRRGLTRMEVKTLKKIQIEQLKLRIENMKNLKHETVEENAIYLEKKEMLEKYQRDASEVVYQMKYTYDQQLKDLKIHIDSEKEALGEREQWWKDTNEEIISLSEQLMLDLGTIMDDPELVAKFGNFGISIKELLEDVKAVQSETTGAVTPETEPSVKAGAAFRKIFGGAYDVLGLPSLARGLQYVHETGPAMLHRGETIGPAGKDVGSGISIDHVTIEVKEIADIGSIEKLSALLSQAESSGLMRKGKTNYKLRFE